MQRNICLSLPLAEDFKIMGKKNKHVDKNKKRRRDDSDDDDADTLDGVPQASMQNVEVTTYLRHNCHINCAVNVLFSCYQVKIHTL